jgi:trk system potassium uptake protein TrkH
MFFFILMMIGGCTGSTSGSIKILRYQIMFAVAKSHIYQIRRPHGIFPPTYDGKPIPETISISVFTFFALYIVSFGLLVMGLGLYDLDVSTSLSAAASALNNIGPGFGPSIGPSGTFTSLPDGAKWMLMAGMLLGRLEYITFLILFVPSFWRD